VSLQLLVETELNELAVKRWQMYGCIASPIATAVPLHASAAGCGRTYAALRW